MYVNYLSIKLTEKKRKRKENTYIGRSDKVRKMEKAEQGRWVGMRRWGLLLQEGPSEQGLE